MVMICCKWVEWKGFLFICSVLLRKKTNIDLMASDFQLLVSLLYLFYPLWCYLFHSCLTCHVNWWSQSFLMVTIPVGTSSLFSLENTTIIHYQGFLLGNWCSCIGLLGAQNTYLITMGGSFMSSVRFWRFDVHFTNHFQLSLTPRAFVAITLFKGGKEFWNS